MIPLVASALAAALAAAPGPAGPPPTPAETDGIRQPALSAGAGPGRRAPVPEAEPAPQQGALSVAPDPAAGYRAVVAARGVLDDPALREALASGLPLRLRFHVELWRDGFFDDLVGDDEWTAVVVYRPLERQYVVRTMESPAKSAVVTSFQAARGAVEGVYHPDLKPPRPGRYYYTASLIVETLSLSDLEELEQWLQGELRPTIREGGSLADALGQGAKRLLVRVLGLPARRYETRSDKFQVP